jgi:hypothetical protein
MAIRGLLSGAGNFLFGAGTFGDPRQAARAHAPPGLLGAFSAEEQEELGRQLQRRLRAPGSRGQISQQFQQQVASDALAKQEAQAREQLVQSIAQANMPESMRQLYTTFARTAPPEKVMQALTDVHSAAPGHQLFTGTGEQLAAAPTRSIQEHQYQQLDPSFTAMSDDATSAIQTREAKIQDYQNTYGVTRGEAIGLVDGQLRLTTDEQGNRVLTDLTRGGRSRLLEVEGIGDPGPAPTVPGRTGRTDLTFDPAKGTGVAGTGRLWWNRTVGQIPGFKTFSEAEDVAQKLRIVERDAVLAMAVSSRPPVIEQERIASLVPQPGDWLQNPEAARDRMASFVDLMMAQYYADRRAGKDRTLDSKVRADVGRRANEIRNIVGRLVTQERLDELFPLEGLPPSGISQRHWDVLTPEEREEWMR